MNTFQQVEMKTLFTYQQVVVWKLFQEVKSKPLLLQQQPEIGPFPVQ